MQEATGTLSWLLDEQVVATQLLEDEAVAGVQEATAAVPVLVEQRVAVHPLAELADTGVQEPVGV